jgi:hypothetical protein
MKIYIAARYKKRAELSKAQGAFWPVLDGAWALNLNPNNAGGVVLNGNVSAQNVGDASIKILAFGPVITSGSMNLNTSVQALDITRWMQVRDLTEEMGELYGGNWLGSAIWHLKLRILSEGYSDGVMADYWAVKARLHQ